MAWEPLGWRAAAFAEIAPFPSAVLAHRWPQVPNLGDFTAISAETVHALGPVSVCIAGTPCQPFSIAGLRQGLDDPRGNLALAFLRIVDLARPRWVVWENVPGVLSSNRGRDFGTFLGALAKLGYGFAYRVLDAQYFGVAQRRRRVFVVGCLGDWRSAAAVLFERDCLSGNPAPRRQAGARVAGTLEVRAGSGGFDPGAHGAAAGHLVAAGLAPTLAASGEGAARTGNARTESDFLIAHTLRAGGFDASEDGTGRGTPLVATASNWQSGGDCRIKPTAERTDALHANQTPAVYHSTVKTTGHQGDTVVPCSSVWPCLPAQTANNGGGGGAILHRLSEMAVRRITPVEAERLQGFPDGYTAVSYCGRPATACPDGPRYHALGNSMAVTVIQWIGKRIDLADSLLLPHAHV